MADPTVPPDLASILATLAQFAPQQQQDQQQPPPPTATTPTITDPRLQRRQNQPTIQPYNQTPQTLQQQNTSQTSTPYNPQAAIFQPVISQQRVITQPSRTSTPQQQEHTIIDPATITEWSAGLRCVTKIAAQNPLFAEKIRGLINDQRRNEMQCKTIGTTNTTPTPQTLEEKAAELHAFDQKLYKAQCAMNESMSQVLKHLGVPFFGTHAALILPDGTGEAGGSSQSSGGDKVIDTQGDRPKWSPRVTAKELMELKRRMVAYLEDMYKA
ncbi:hypothetical protein E4T44_07707 [Aureobasidium sp. EXF-8845]|nr:hypothetical protein E4T44_07707 [Aureobasidium sp. EXF-8845]KAI4847367.1 hypothetical protein E4T45_06814 [Aureobasidium sp. EXF-8846]